MERKQIGCMTGFIHLFDPNQNQAVLPKRITNSMTTKTLQGNSKFFQGSCEAEQITDPYLQHGMEMRSNRNSNDRFGNGIYTESSKASCSSSPSSSFSSLDYNKVMHAEPSSYDRMLFPVSPLLDRSLSHSSRSWRIRQQSFDLDDMVQDGAEDSLGLKTDNSQRPVQPMKSSIASLNKGSTKAIPKFKDSLCLYNEDQKPLRLFDESKGYQYEYERGREWYRHEIKETPKNNGALDELARLSMDSSTECSVLNSEFRTSHKNQRAPSIVEKLMGLDGMPGVSNSTTKNSNRFVKIGDRQDSNMMNKSASLATESMPVKVLDAQRFLRKDQAVHKWKYGESVMKPVSSSKIFIEPAPWKQLAVKSKQGSGCESNGVTTLYSKFEGRLKDIEIQRSSKDLMALKQMLNAVQQNSPWQGENKLLSNGMTVNHNSGLDITRKTVQRQTYPNACTSMANGKPESSAKTLTSPIVVMKPFRLLEKSDIAASSVIRSEGMPQLSSKPQESNSAIRRKALFNTQPVKGQIPRHGYQSPRIRPSEKKLTRTQPTLPQRLSKEKKTNSVSAGSTSLRMQQKKFEIEKKPRPATTSNNATKLSMPKSTKLKNSCTSSEKPQLTYSIEQCNGQQSGLSTESKDTFCGEEAEVTSKLRLEHIDGTRSPARKVVRPMLSGIRKHKPNWIASEDNVHAHPAIVAAEQPSPVSVLDSTPSPLIRKTAGCGTAELVTNMSREKLKQIDDLVHKLNGVGSAYDNESNSDFIASLCNTTNPDQRYISKILLASGFLFRDFEFHGSNFQPHISGYPINPELFFVMEQTKSSALLTKDRNKCSALKSHRRLIFDSCNEILAEMLIPSGISNDSKSTPRKLARRSITAQQLLKHMCDQIEHLQAKNTAKGEAEKKEEGHDEDHDLKQIVYEDMMLKSDKWGNSEKSMSEVVLDIERMLFKDLVKEIVSDESISLCLRAKSGRSCDRKLHFNKVCELES